MTATAAKPARRNARRCMGRYDNGRKCTQDVFDGELTCPKCRAAGGIRPAPYRN